MVERNSGLIRENINEIRERVSSAAKRAGRSAGDITLVGVSKFQPLELIYDALLCGITVLGENRVQERAEKAAKWDGRAAVWHMIGRLQRNKVRKAVDLFDCIQSIDGHELALSVERAVRERMESGGEPSGDQYPVMVEVNTSGEESKGGIEPFECIDLVEAIISRCPHLRVEGLMTIGPLHGGESETRESFALLRRLATAVKDYNGLVVSHISMGMSGDFEAAIEEGSTMVRIGTGIFGARRL
ncbi:MAG: YggS family pyridoxal phosphate-dependent enzyme [Synergistaceae bacterium]|jgi:pyridoxal phosphate enzyme (YggS family)|nr:YggS family pyridoxal phosphate-dependent enzyme [Synergistaceae bacterium]